MTETPHFNPKWRDLVPPEFAEMKFDGGDVLPFDRNGPDAEKIIWLYRTACQHLLEQQVKSA